MFNDSFNRDGGFKKIITLGVIMFGGVLLVQGAFMAALIYFVIRVAGALQ